MAIQGDGRLIRFSKNENIIMYSKFFQFVKILIRCYIFRRRTISKLYQHDDSNRLRALAVLRSAA